MKWGLKFRLPVAYESEIWGLPPPTKIKRLRNIDGKEFVSVFYHFIYAPQNWQEWQRVATIKENILHRIKGVEFLEIDPYSYNDVETDNVYKISDIGSYFKAFVKFPMPLYPAGKDEAYQRLCVYTKRLHFESKLHVEQVIATSIRFNEAYKNDEGFTQTYKRAISAYKFASKHRDEWKVKLTEEQLNTTRISDVNRLNDELKAKRKPKQLRAKELRKDGVTITEIASIIEVSKSTIKRWLKQ